MSLDNKLFKNRKIKVYSVKKSAMDSRLNVGNDYRSNMLQNSLSKHIQRNTRVSTFIILLQEVLADLVDAVAHLKSYKSFTVNKEDKRAR